MNKKHFRMQDNSSLPVWGPYKVILEKMADFSSSHY